MSATADYRRTVLPNGLRLVTEQIPHLRSVALGIWVATGTRDEKSAENGISHFVEHMVFKGSRKRSAREIAESIESVGGYLNAFTSTESTCFYAHLLDEDVAVAVDVLCDLITQPLFEETEIAKEKQVVLDEISNSEDAPEEVVHQLFLGDLFPNHSIGFSILGTRETVSGFSREDLFRYMGRNFTQNRVVVAAAGNATHERIVDLIGHNLETLPPDGTRSLIAPPPQGSPLHVEEANIVQAHLVVGTQSYSYHDPKKYPLSVLNTLFGGGMSSRLFQSVRETHGLAYSVYSFLDFLLDTGVFGIYAGTDKDKLSACQEIFREELEELRRRPVPVEELERTKSQLKGSLMLGLESTSGRMSRLAKLELYSDEYYTLDDTIQQIDRVTQDDILEVANELLYGERLLTTILKPKNGGANGNRRSEGNQAL